MKRKEGEREGLKSLIINKGRRITYSKQSMLRRRRSWFRTSHDRRWRGGDKYFLRLGEGAGLRGGTSPEGCIRVQRMKFWRTL